jgi:opacity protein-like surface antigen
MVRLKILVAAIFTALLFTSESMAQELLRNELSVQGTGFFTADSEENGIRQHTSNSGGLLVSYRFHINRWFAADASYGYSRNSHNYITSDFAYSTQSNIHQTTGALVITSPRKFAGFRPFALAGVGALTFDPTQNVGVPELRFDSQTKAAFIYGGGADIDITRHFALRVEYRGLIYQRPDFVVPSLNAGATTHTAQPSAGFVIRF